MPGNVRPVADERDGLLSFLAQARLVLRVATYGLTDEQARATPSASSLSVGGLVKHVTQVEHNWMDMVEQRPRDPEAEKRYMDSFTLAPDETLAGLLESYDESAKRTEQVVAGFDDLNAPVPVPKGVPWFPQDVDAWSVRWVLLHLISETTRHAGHADIVRESIDGATAFPLMAAYEKWPATTWLQPWEPTKDPRG